MTRRILVLLLGATFWASALSVGCGAGYSDGAPASSNQTGYNNLGSSGAQDIGQFRKILDEGGVPGEDTLDANGFFSEHYTELPPPECGQPICAAGMLSVGHDWVFGRYQAALQIGMNTTIDASSLERRPLDLVVVVDTSGSMAGDDKIRYVRDGLHLLVDQLGPEDRMALVRYDTEVQELVGLAEEADATTLHDLIGALGAGGGTNFYGGLERGMEIAVTDSPAEREARVILLSDGQPTAGPYTDDESIIGMAEEYIADGVGLTTIGVGLDFNVNLMRGLAERGAGNFYFLEDAAAIDEVFTEELSYFVTPVAYDLHVEVVSGAAYQLGDVVGTHLWRTDGYRGTIDMPAVFLAGRTGSDDPPAEDPRRRGGGSAIFVNLVPMEAWQDAADPHRVAEITLSYRLAGSGERVEQTVVVENPLDPGVAEEMGYASHEAIQKNQAVYNTFLGLRQACREAVTSYNHALWVLEALRSAAAAWNDERGDADIDADLALIDEFAANLEADGAYPVDPSSDPWACDSPSCGDDMHFQESAPGFFLCSTGRARDTSPIAAALLLVFFAAWRRRRAAARR